MKQTDVIIVAAEPSGDQLGADLAEALTRQKTDIEIAAIGGERLESVGYPSLMSVEGLAVVGIIEGLKIYRLVRQKVQESSSLIMGLNPQCVVLIDSWGFMVRVAEALKKSGYKGQIIKYVAPQVWAMRPGRAKTLARFVDHLLSTQPMDKPYFDAAGLAQTFVGNPVLDKDYRAGTREDFLVKYNLGKSRLIIGLFLGSRPSEIERVGPAILATLKYVQSEHPNATAICVIAEPVRKSAERLLSGTNVIAIPQSDFIDALAATDYAIACSGTVTTQLAAAGIPSVVLYKLSNLTFWMVSKVFKPRYISLVNISADGVDRLLDSPLMPEFVQDDIMSDKPAKALLDIMADPDAAKTLRQSLICETRRMGAGSKNASDRAASAVLSFIG